ncbi:MAG: hypothetical protein JXA73_07220 [Acidobacteria bacterium]|nr:hypothetical protein [Acidobacteriota bacterium]
MEFLPHVSVMNEIQPEIRVGFIGDIMDLGSKRLCIGRDITEYFNDCDAIVGNFEGMITDQRKRSLTQQRHTLQALFGRSSHENDFRSNPLQ